MPAYAIVVFGVSKSFLDFLSNRLLRKESKKTSVYDPEKNRGYLHH